MIVGGNGGLGLLGVCVDNDRGNSGVGWVVLCSQLLVQLVEMSCTNWWKTKVCSSGGSCELIVNYLQSVTSTSCVNSYVYRWTCFGFAGLSFMWVVVVGGNYDWWWLWVWVVIIDGNTGQYSYWKERDWQ